MTELNHLQDRLYRDWWLLKPHERDQLKHKIRLLKERLTNINK
jgi:hypothetical protein